MGREQESLFVHLFTATSRRPNSHELQNYTLWLRFVFQLQGSGASDVQRFRMWNNMKPEASGESWVHQGNSPWWKNAGTRYTSSVLNNGTSCFLIPTADWRQIIEVWKNHRSLEELKLRGTKAILTSPGPCPWESGTAGWHPLPRAPRSRPRPRRECRREHKHQQQKRGGIRFTTILCPRDFKQCSWFIVRHLIPANQSYGAHKSRM